MTEPEEDFADSDSETGAHAVEDDTYLDEDLGSGSDFEDPDPGV